MGYYFSTPTSRAGYKIRQFLHQIEIPHKIVEKPFKLNKLILIPFMIENNMKYMQLNPRYKGINTADLQNCYDILSNEEIWNKFRKYCKDKKEYYKQII